MFKRLLLSLSLILAGASAFAGDYGYNQPFLDIIGTNSIDGITVNSVTPAPGTFSSLTVTGASTFQGGTNPSGTVASTSLYGNPLMLDTVQNLTVASVNTTGGYTLITGVNGRTIYPGNLVLLASGSGSSSTGIKILCTSGRVLASINLGNIVTAVNLVPLASSGLNPGLAYTEGCASGDGIYVSNIGTNLGSLMNLLVNLPYTVQ